MTLLEKRKQYLANIFVLIPKLHNLHWNIVGAKFLPLHEFTEQLYNEFFLKYDEVAEMLKMEGVYPTVKVSEYEKLSNIEELDSKEFETKELLSIVKSDLELMKKLAAEIREEADKEGHFVLVGAMEGDIAGYTKHIWFVDSMLK